MNIELVHEEIARDVRAAGTSEGVNLVAYSGGVDSAVIAKLVYTAFPGNTEAVIGVSASMPEEQLELARSIAREIGVPLRDLKTTEGDVPGYVENEGASCYHCKTTLYKTMQDIAGSVAMSQEGTTGQVVLFNGTNADDMTDPTRVGIVAAREYRVAGPLEKLTKDQVRELSRHLGLSNWDYAASPCLRSRLQYGVAATPENLARIEAAEREVRASCGLDARDNLRVRHLVQDVACIEVDESKLPKIEGSLLGLREKLRALGYEDVSVRPFRSGSLSHLASLSV